MGWTTGRSRVSTVVRLLLVAPLLVATSACSGADAGGDRLLVLAASSLQHALPEIAADFERRTGMGVDLVFGSSGNLTAQIESGAPADLLFSADRAFVERLDRAGRIVPGSTRDYAVGRIAIVVPPGRALPAALEEVASAEHSVLAVANPETAPYGLAARQALERAGLWDAVVARVVYAENIAQAAQFVRTGNADVGFIALSVVLEHPGWEHRMVDAALHDPVVQAAAVVSGGPNVERARAFLDLVISPAGAAVLSRFGFEAPQ